MQEGVKHFELPGFLKRYHAGGSKAIYTTSGKSLKKHIKESVLAK